MRLQSDSKGGGPGLGIATIRAHKEATSATLVGACFMKKLNNTAPVAASRRHQGHRSRPLT